LKKVRVGREDIWPEKVSVEGRVTPLTFFPTVTS
jgi:hypothetical protein